MARFSASFCGVVTSDDLILVKDNVKELKVRIKEVQRNIKDGEKELEVIKRDEAVAKERLKSDKEELKRLNAMVTKTERQIKSAGQRKKPPAREVMRDVETITFQKRREIYRDMPY